MNLLMRRSKLTHTHTHKYTHTNTHTHMFRNESINATFALHAQCAAQHKRIMAIAAQFKGLDAGEENGYRGYFLTFMIAYLRDFGVNFSFIAESFETTVPWSNVMMVCESVKKRINETCAQVRIKAPDLANAQAVLYSDSFSVGSLGRVS
jgi:hypothetical protein